LAVTGEDACLPLRRSRSNGHGIFENAVVCELSAWPALAKRRMALLISALMSFNGVN
jgi:hypothetical protein